MHDDSSIPPKQAGPTLPPGSPEPAGMERAAMQDDARDYSAVDTGTGLVAVPVSPWRRRVLWLLAGTMAVVAACGTTVVVRRLQEEQALHSVARAVAISAAAPEPGSHAAARAAPLPAPVAVATSGTSAADNGTDGGPTAGLSAPGQAQDVPSAPMHAAARPGGDTGESRNAAEKSNAAKTVPDIMEARAAEEGGVAQGPRARDGNRKAAARAVKRGDAAERRPATKRAKRDGGTFKRCPPLGKKGAVMCRWHICNGAAGKERVCRPYLERKP